MLMNLPYELELEKMRALTSQVENSTRIKPQAFRAGRWAFGPEMVKAHIVCAYRIDSSVTPMTFSKEGSSYESSETEPYWLPQRNDYTQCNGNILLEIPVTVGFNRWPFEFWQRVHLRL